MCRVEVPSGQGSSPKTPQCPMEQIAVQDMTTPGVMKMNEQDTVHQFPQVPADVPGEIRALKAGLRDRIGDVEGIFRRLEDRIRGQVEEIEATRARGEEVWPVIDYADIEAGTVTAEPAGSCSSGAAARWSAGTSPASRPRSGTGDSWTTSRATTSSSQVQRPGGRLLRHAERVASRKSTRSTGPAPRWRPGSIRGWPRSRPS